MTGPRGGDGAAARGRLQGKVTIITGASRGIGAAAGELFASQGATVVLASRDEDSLQSLAKQINATGGSALAVPTDVSDPRSVANLVSRTVDAYGRLDAAFNNAASTTAFAPTHLMDVDDFDRTIKTNLYGIFYCLKFEVAAMLANGGGAIVNTTSTGGLRATANCVDYVASKHGVIGLTKTAAVDYANQGIRVNALAPGWIRTKMVLDAFSDDELESIGASIPIGRIGEPVEAAQVAAWLLSDDASYVNGVTLLVDAGATAR
jgi:NAD(P)-dependent dehydrogenase (short-subunit alcohol dehydrogenase family)